MLDNFRHAAVGIKRLIYGAKGEPFAIPGHVLRYEPGSRPVHPKHATAADKNRRYDALQVQLFSTDLSEGDVAVDVGSHAGQYAIIMAARCGASGTVIAFEPDPHARQRFERNLKLNPRIKRPTVEPMALSDTAGTAVLYSHGGNSQSSLARSGIGGAFPEQIQVPLMRLDDYLDQKRLPVPRWVKIDAEGAEIRILMGAPKLLRSEAGIVCELHPYAWPEFGNNATELKALAAAAGRRIRYLDGHTEIADHPEYGTVVLERLS